MDGSIGLPNVTIVPKSMVPTLTEKSVVLACTDLHRQMNLTSPVRGFTYKGYHTNVAAVPKSPGFAQQVGVGPQFSDAKMGRAGQRVRHTRQPGPMSAALGVAKARHNGARNPICVYEHKPVERKNRNDYAKHFHAYCLAGFCEASLVSTLPVAAELPALVFCLQRSFWSNVVTHHNSSTTNFHQLFLVCMGTILH